MIYRYKLVETRNSIAETTRTGTYAEYADYTPGLFKGIW